MGLCCDLGLFQLSAEGYEETLGLCCDLGLFRLKAETKTGSLLRSQLASRICSKHALHQADEKSSDKQITHDSSDSNSMSVLQLAAHLLFGLG